MNDRMMRVIEQVEHVCDVYYEGSLPNPVECNLLLYNHFGRFVENFDQFYRQDMVAAMVFGYASLTQLDVDDIWERVETERHRQRELWGDVHDDQHDAQMWARIILRYVGRADAALDDSREAYIQEMVKVLALGVASLESKFRQKVAKGQKYEWKR